LIESARKVAEERLYKCQKAKMKDWSSMKNAVRSDLQDYIYQQTKRNPVILPIFMEV